MSKNHNFHHKEILEDISRFSVQDHVFGNASCTKQSERPSCWLNLAAQYNPECKLNS